MNLLTKKRKQQKIISTKISDIEHMNFLSRYMGKQVFSQSGDKIGKVKDVVIDKGIHKGFLLSNNLFIDKEYFNKDFDQAMLLQIEPVTKLVGKLVFDADGKKIGKVKDIERVNNSNDFKAILVKKNIFSKPIVIGKQNISITQKNIILKIAVGKY